MTAGSWYTNTAVVRRRANSPARDWRERAVAMIDLLLLHAPSVYDFRERAILFIEEARGK